MPACLPAYTGTLDPLTAPTLGEKRLLPLCPRKTNTKKEDQGTNRSSHVRNFPLPWIRKIRHTHVHISMYLKQEKLEPTKPCPCEGGKEKHARKDVTLLLCCALFFSVLFCAVLFSSVLLSVLSVCMSVCHVILSFSPRKKTSFLIFSLSSFS